MVSDIPAGDRKLVNLFFTVHTALSENAAPHGHASPPGHKMSPNWPICFVAVNPAHHQSWAYSWHLDILLIPAALHLLIIEA